MNRPEIKATLCTRYRTKTNKTKNTTEMSNKMRHPFARTDPVLSPAN